MAQSVDAAAQLAADGASVSVTLAEGSASAEQRSDGCVMLSLVTRQDAGAPLHLQPGGALQLVFAPPTAPEPVELTTFYYSLGDDDESSAETPVSELAGLLADGTITAETLCWREGLPEWQPLAECTQLMGLARMATIVEGTDRSSVRRVVAHRGRDHLRAIYDSLDADGDGSVSWAELSLAASHGLGILLSHTDLDRMFDQAGSAASRVGFEKFCELVESQAVASAVATSTGDALLSRPGWATVARRGSLALHAATAAAAAAHALASGDGDMWSDLPVSAAPIEVGVAYFFHPDETGELAWSSRPVEVQVSPDTFGEGAMRCCAHLKKREVGSADSSGAWKLCVGKQYKDFGLSEQEQEARHRTDVRLQARTRQLADAFNAAGPVKKIEVLDACYVVVPTVGTATELGAQNVRDEPAAFFVESFVSGQFVKHNSNTGWVGNITDDAVAAADHIRQTPQTFSYFTWIFTDGAEMVTDVQGVADLYTDPQIHSLPDPDREKYGVGDMGQNGMLSFLSTHIYSVVDAHLRLPPFFLSRQEVDALQVARTRQLSKTTTPDLADTHDEEGVPPSTARTETATMDGIVAPTIPREKLELHAQVHVALAGHLLSSSADTVRQCFRVATPHPYWRSRVPQPGKTCAATHLALATAMCRSLFSATTTPSATHSQAFRRAQPIIEMLVASDDHSQANESNLEAVEAIVLTIVMFGNELGKRPSHIPNAPSLQVLPLESVVEQIWGTIGELAVAGLGGAERVVAGLHPKEDVALTAEEVGRGVALFD